MNSFLTLNSDSDSLEGVPPRDDSSEHDPDLDVENNVDDADDDVA